MGSVSGDSGHGSSHTDAYDELFQTPSMADLDPLDNDQEETGNKVGSFWLLPSSKRIYKNESGQQYFAFCWCSSVAYSMQRLHILHFYFIFDLSPCIVL